MTTEVAQAAPISRPSRSSRRWVRTGARLGPGLVAVAGVLLWAVASSLTFVIPSPVATLDALVSSLSDERYLMNLRSTAVAVAIAVVMSIVVGVLFGLAFGLSSRISRGFEPLVVASNGVPKIVLYPGILLVFGMGTTSKVVLATVIGMFPVLMNVAAGIRHMPPVYQKLGRSLGTTRWQQFAWIIVPAIRKPFLTGIRLAVSLATVGVVLAEMFATDLGLGRVILAAHTAGQHERMLSTVLLLLVVAFVLSTLLWRWEKRAR